MTSTDEHPFWWGSATFRITHPAMDPSEISDRVKPALENDCLEKLKVTSGYNNRKAAFWFGEYRIESPDRPNKLIAWVEYFVQTNKPSLIQLRELGCKLYVYVGIHTRVIAVGFELPPTPTLWELSIPIGVEFFSS